MLNVVAPFDIRSGNEINGGSLDELTKDDLRRARDSRQSHQHL